VTEQELLLDCVRRLNQTGVAYMLTGSMASNAWAFLGLRTIWTLSYNCRPRRFPPCLALFLAPTIISMRPPCALPAGHRINVISSTSLLR